MPGRNLNAQPGEGREIRQIVRLSCRNDLCGSHAENSAGLSKIMATCGSTCKGEPTIQSVVDNNQFGGPLHDAFGKVGADKSDYGEVVRDRKDICEQ